MGRRLIIMVVLMAALGVKATSADAAAPSAYAAVAPIQVVSADRATVLRDGLTFRQAVKVPGFVSWDARLAAAPKPGKVAAHAAGELVSDVFTREFAVPQTGTVTLKLTPRGARLVQARRLARLIVTTTVMPDGGERVAVTRAVTLRG